MSLHAPLIFAAVPPFPTAWRWPLTTLQSHDDGTHLRRRIRLAVKLADVCFGQVMTCAEQPRARSGFPLHSVS